MRDKLVAMRDEKADEVPLTVNNSKNIWNHKKSLAK